MNLVHKSMLALTLFSFPTFSFPQCDNTELGTELGVGESSVLDLHPRQAFYHILLPSPSVCKQRDKQTKF